MRLLDPGNAEKDYTCGLSKRKFRGGNNRQRERKLDNVTPCTFLYGYRVASGHACRAQYILRTHFHIKNVSTPTGPPVLLSRVLFLLLYMNRGKADVISPARMLVDGISHFCVCLQFRVYERVAARFTSKGFISGYVQEGVYKIRSRQAFICSGMVPRLA